jgi:hypothetical protein
MRSCPDIDRLIAFALGEGDVAEELATHVGTCATCSQDVAVLRLTREAFSEAENPSAALVARAAGIAHTPVDRGAVRPAWPHQAGTFVLGSITAVLALALSGTLGDPLSPVLAAAAGLAAALLEPRLMRGEAE